MSVNPDATHFARFSPLPAARRRGSTEPGSSVSWAKCEKRRGQEVGEVTTELSAARNSWQSKLADAWDPIRSYLRRFCGRGGG